MTCAKHMRAVTCRWTQRYWVWGCISHHTVCLLSIKSLTKLTSIGTAENWLNHIIWNQDNFPKHALNCIVLMLNSWSNQLIPGSLILSNISIYLLSSMSDNQINHTKVIEPNHWCVPDILTLSLDANYRIFYTLYACDQPQSETFCLING